MYIETYIVYKYIYMYIYIRYRVYVYILIHMVYIVYIYITSFHSSIKCVRSSLVGSRFCH